MQHEPFAPELEPELPPPVGGGLRATGYVVVIGLLLAGVSMRYGGQIGSFVQAHYGALSPQSQDAAAGPPVRGVVELAMVPDAAVPSAAAGMGLSPPDLALLTGALKDDRLKLVRVPLFDAAAVSGGGDAVRVSAGGYTTMLTLTAAPQTVLLPISGAATISFSAIGKAPAQIGMLTALGPARLPPIAAGDLLSVGVIAQ